MNVLTNISQQIKVEKPVQMSEQQETAYEKYLEMVERRKDLKNIEIDFNYQKEVIKKKRNENQDWVEYEKKKRSLQQELAELEKEAMEILVDLNVEMGNDLDKLTSLEHNKKRAKKLFDSAALECAKDPLQIPLILFDNEGFACESVKTFEAKLVKQKKPRKKNRENAYNKTQFIKENFELKLNSSNGN